MFKSFNPFEEYEEVTETVSDWRTGKTSTRTVYLESDNSVKIPRKSNKLDLNDDEIAEAKAHAERTRKELSR